MPPKWLDENSRDIAIISGMVFTGYPNKGIKMKHLQSNSQLLFEVFRDYEPENLLFQQAFTETFQHQLEEGRLRLSMERIATQEIIWKRCEKATPFAFPLITDRLSREKLSSEKWEDRVRRYGGDFNEKVTDLQGVANAGGLLVGLVYSADLFRSGCLVSSSNLAIPTRFSRPCGIFETLQDVGMTRKVLPKVVTFGSL